MNGEGKNDPKFDDPVRFLVAFNKRRELIMKMIDAADPQLVLVAEWESLCKIFSDYRFAELVTCEKKACILAPPRYELRTAPELLKVMHVCMRTPSRTRLRKYMEYRRRWVLGDGILARMFCLVNQTTQHPPFPRLSLRSAIVLKAVRTICRQVAS
jgi:hypothetical protein